MPRIDPYHVDGHEHDDLDSPLTGDGKFGPFCVFDPDAQEWLPGTYATREEAQAEADRLNEIAPDCAAGLHSWIDEVGKLPADTACTRCGELYGEPA